VQVHGLPGLRHSNADLITAPITVGIVNREYLRRVQGLVYVAYKMEEPRKRDCPSLWFVLVLHYALILTHRGQDVHWLGFSDLYTLASRGSDRGKALI
jgi:hypothetical protein